MAGSSEGSGPSVSVPVKSNCGVVEVDERSRVIRRNSDNKNQNKDPNNSEAFCEIDRFHGGRSSWQCNSSVNQQRAIHLLPCSPPNPKHPPLAATIWRTTDVVRTSGRRQSQPQYSTRIVCEFWSKNADESKSLLVSNVFCLFGFVVKRTIESNFIHDLFAERRSTISNIRIWRNSSLQRQPQHRRRRILIRVQLSSYRRYCRSFDIKRNNFLPPHFRCRPDRSPRMKEPQLLNIWHLFQLFVYSLSVKIKLSTVKHLKLTPHSESDQVQSYE